MNLPHPELSIGAQLVPDWHAPYFGRERLPVRIFADEHQAARAVADRIAQRIRENTAADKNTVLGLATGHTPVGVYDRLIQLHREGLDLSRVVTFNLDEYWPMPSDALQSYHRWMHENLFDHVNIPAENIHIPAGDVPRDQLERHCQTYEDAIRAVGGIDLQILGIGKTGHIGFNEPGSPPESRTRLVTLDPVTRRDAASDFFGEENVPRHAITMGLATILEAREICLLAFGEHKSAIVRRSVEEPPSAAIAQYQ